MTVKNSLAKMLAKGISTIKPVSIVEKGTIWELLSMIRERGKAELHGLE
jgi:hypothetical protein